MLSRQTVVTIAWVLLALLLSWLTPLDAQVNRGVIEGFVTDSQGAVVPGVDVTITSVDRNIAQPTRTNSAGYYLNGHSHNYERAHPQHGVVHITAGTGGAELEERNSPCLFAECPAPSWSAFRAMRFGIVKLYFSSGEIRGSSLCGPAGGGKNDIQCIAGSVVDHFSVRAP